MAAIASQRCRNVRCGFAACGTAIMASGTRAGRHVRVTKCRRFPRSSTMASVATLVGRYMVGWLAFHHAAVVTHCAASRLHRAVRKRRRRPPLALVTGVALLCGRNMIGRLCGT